MTAIRIVLSAVLFFHFFAPPAPLRAAEEVAGSVRLGTTFSKRQCEYLGLDWKETYLEVLSAGFDIVRLGAYWEEIEEKEGRYNFENLDWQLAHAEERNIPVLLTVGMKAPRWPEFFIPGWLRQRISIKYGADVALNPFLRQKTLEFIRAVVSRYKDKRVIGYWQVENEPLDRSGGDWWWINQAFLKEETILVRELDPLKRPIVINVATFPNSFLRRLRDFFSRNRPIPESLAVADIWALNIYPVVGHRFWRFNYYFWTHPRERGDYFRDLQKMARENGKEIWITELQAEPWEPGHLVYRDAVRPPTGNPAMLADNYKELRELGFRTIFLWGTEYWEFREEVHHDRLWWDTFLDILKYEKSQREPAGVSPE